LQDSGIGLTEEEIAHIFDRFYRSERKEVMMISGNGLGMSIADAIVRRLEGTIDVQSEGPGLGSRFVVRL